jgi:hypothetical protein
MRVINGPTTIAPHWATFMLVTTATLMTTFMIYVDWCDAVAAIALDNIIYP